MYCQWDCTDTRPSRRSTGANYIEQLEKKVKELEALIGGSAAIDDHGDDDQFDIFDESNGAETQHERATDPPSHRHIHRSSDPNAVLSAADEEMLETMIPVSDSSPMPGEGLSAYRGRFAGLSLLERLRNLCSRLAGQAEKRPADSSREDFVYAFDYPSPTSNPIEPSDGFAILPAKGTILQRVQIAFDQACCLMQFMHQPTVESHIHCIYAIEPEHYTKEDRKFLALLYALLALGTRFAEDDPKGVQSNGVQTLSKG
ncbi:Gypsy retrotransposon integrase-like protein 1 [Cryomyces antarcticus]|uniref:Gypsy retrotransposon integrase-like protein 1 n=1 Tax=Cryomyces antarcticus TaxID=329879 RepID=A0ABR0KU20_9PEZI|nr:Gypsy retrotransposon integrase-like protein 1 [Cryomyces antarcticus]KAK5020187.1 Gypsy retrotransposon integrase-like protein 1 [Cryomyces antarcticus]KAK5130570.1 Gypsy retrotransposon integrase-like protein 1 [Cryomyces antarcticus]